MDTKLPPKVPNQETSMIVQGDDALLLWTGPHSNVSPENIHCLAPQNCLHSLYRNPFLNPCRPDRANQSPKISLTLKTSPLDHPCNNNNHEKYILHKNADKHARIMSLISQSSSWLDIPFQRVHNTPFTVHSSHRRTCNSLEYTEAHCCVDSSLWLMLVLLVTHDSSALPPSTVSNPRS